MGKYDYDKRNIIVRIAILLEYDYIDFYSKEKIDYKKLEVDHIIPCSFVKSNEDLMEIKKRFSLDEDFNIDSLLNYVPTCRAVNRSKSNRFFSEFYMDLALKTAKKNAPKIKRRIEQLKKEKKLDTLVANVNANLKNGNDIEDFINKVWGKENKEGKEQSKLVYQNNKRRVSVLAYAPDDNKFFNGICITFNKIDISGSCITPSYKVVSNSLFSYINFPMKKRQKFYVGFDSENLMNIIQIGDNRLCINDEDLEDLCDILDDFYIWYTDRLIEIEKERNTLNYPLFNKENYLLCDVDKSVWINFQEYIKDFVEKNGFDGFEYNKSCIKVCDGKHGRGFHLYLGTKEINDRTYILWNKNFMEGDWNFQKAVDWFYGEFLNDVNRFLDTQSRFKRKNFFIKSKKDKSTLYIKVNKPCQVFVNNNKCITNKEFLETILLLEEICLRRFDLFLKTEEMVMYFKAMILLISKSEEKHLPYLIGNLSFLRERKVIDNIKNNSDLLKCIEDEIVEIEKQNGFEYSFYFTFRNIKVCAENCYTKLTQSEINLILDELSPLIDYYNRRTILDKYNNFKENTLI